MLCTVLVRFSDCDLTSRKQKFNMILNPNHKNAKILVYIYSEESNIYEIK